MPSDKTILFIGHSHVECIAAAILQDKLAAVHVLNINTVMQAKRAAPTRIMDRLFRRKSSLNKAIVTAILKQSPVKKPDAICLCIGGNDHNILGLFENPTPFAIGEATGGSAPPDDSDRHFIPYNLIRDYFEERLMLGLMQDLFDAFPNAARLYLNPPPPISDWNHIKSHPGIFRRQIEMGPAPAALKKQLYRVQTGVLRAKASDCGAAFVEAMPELLDAQGFLAAEYYNADPTHGNVAYGRAMLTHISERV